MFPWESFLHPDGIDAKQEEGADEYGQYHRLRAERIPSAQGYGDVQALLDEYHLLVGEA